MGMKYRKHSKRLWRVQKKALTANRSKHTSFHENTHVIGTKSLLYNESVNLTSYQWSKLFPLLHGNQSYQPAVQRVRSLKLMCAEKLARDVQLLEKDYLNYASWSCWRLVWEMILRLNNDSFRSYHMFSLKFATFKGFRAHRPSPMITKPIQSLSPQQQLNVIRDKAIELTCPSQSTSYRLENLFSNAPISDVIYRLNRTGLLNRPLVVLDISSAANIIAKDDYYLLFNLSGLIALDISSSDKVDDSFIQNLSTSIAVEGKLQMLQVIKAIGCCNITLKGIGAILQRCNDDYSRLTCIESDHKLDTIKSGSHRYVPGTKWHLLDTTIKELALITTLPLGLKMQMLHKHFQHLANLESVVQKPVLDMMVSNRMWHNDLDPNSKLDLLHSTWNYRILVRKYDFHGWCYIFNKKHQDSRPSSVVKTLESSRKLKTKIIETNAKKFFSM